MGVMDGERIIKIIKDNNAWKYGDWYKGLIGKEFSVIMYDIMCAEYTVSYDEDFKILPEKDVQIIKDTK